MMVQVEESLSVWMVGEQNGNCEALVGPRKVLHPPKHHQNREGGRSEECGFLLPVYSKQPKWIMWNADEGNFIGFSLCVDKAGKPPKSSSR